MSNSQGDVPPYAESNVQLFRQLVAAGHDEASLTRVRRAYDLAIDLFTGRFRASGRPFLSHLVRTASILVGLDASLDLSLAGLLHGAYARGDFGDGERGITAERRAELRRVVGDAVELRVAAFTRLEWDLHTGPIRPFETLDALEREVLLLRLANELEDHLDFDVWYSADAERRLEYHRASAGPMAELARRLEQPRLAEELDRVFARCLGSLPPSCLRGAVDYSYAIAPRSHRARMFRYRLAARRLASRLPWIRRARAHADGDA